MTCPTTAVYDGLPEAGERSPLGKHLRYFGDGYQKSKLIAGRRFWRLPVGRSVAIRRHCSTRSVDRERS